MKGKLIVKVFADTVALPVEDATVRIIGENTDKVVTTNINGETGEIELDAPSLEFSEKPDSSARPYSLYDIEVTKKGLAPTLIKNVEIYPNETAIQNVFLNSSEETTEENVVTIPDNVLYGDYPPKIPEDPIKPTSPIQKVFPRVVIPEYVIVHNGAPTNTSAKNFYVPFVDYIKNVASGEIYSTWPKETIKANIIAIISFTLNRIYTEWYRSKGYNFTITALPQYDQLYTDGRTIYKSISDIVDEVFNEYLKYPNQIQPFLAQYSDGIKVVRDGWLSQWGSKELGDKGYNYLQILQNYYGNSITTDKATAVSGLPTSYPGYVLKLGACGEEVQKMQNELNKISGSYPAIPKISNPDGNFNEQTKKAVETFQRTFSLPVTGEVDYATWYKISYYYTAVSKLLEGIYS